jgi:hypothetical protein
MRSAAAGMLFFDGQLHRDKFAPATENTNHADSTDGEIRVISEPWNRQSHERA